MRTIISFFFLILTTNLSLSANEESIYDKIDLFGEVLDKINKEYVEEVNQSDAMDAAINGVLQSLDPYSAYMSPELFEEMQTETSGEFGGLGIEVGMEAGVVKVISPIDNSPAEKAGNHFISRKELHYKGLGHNPQIQLSIPLTLPAMLERNTTFQSQNRELRPLF